jgi:hypothetical protein
VAAARPPFRYTLVALAVALLCTVGKAAIGDDNDTVVRFFAELLGVIAGGAFAAAGVNQIARLWLGRHWTRHTAPIVKGYTQQAVTTIGSLAVTCVRIAREVAGHSPSPAAEEHASVSAETVAWPGDGEVLQVFQLPQTEQIRRIMRIYTEPFRALWFDPPADTYAGKRLVASLDVHEAAIASGIAACEALLSSIARYREAYAVTLDKTAVDLRHAAAEVLLYAESDDPDVKMAIGSMMGLFESLHASCEALTDMYAEVARITEKDASYLIVPQTAFTASGRARIDASLGAAKS